MSTADLDLAQLREAALAYLAWEAEVSGLGLPERQLAERSDLAAQAGQGAEPLSAVPRGDPRSTPAAVSADGARGSGVAGRVESSTLAALAGEPAPAQVPGFDRRARLAQLEEEVRSCARCELARARTQTVFARGNPDSPLVFVGEGPGQEEDRLGSPFVGPAGQLLDKMVAAMGYARDDVYICNVVKCRPPGNRTPLPSEAGACAPFLLGQIDALAPRVIVALGRCAAENMGLVSGGGWRGRWGKFRGVDVMPTYHPAFLLRSPEFKRPVWEDLQKVMARLKQGA